MPALDKARACTWYCTPLMNGMPLDTYHVDQFAPLWFRHPAQFFENFGPAHVRNLLL